MGKRSRDIFDPDYRFSPWNESPFAPKNSSISITQLASLLSFLITGGIGFLLYHPLQQHPYGVITLTISGAIAWFLLTAFIALQIRAAVMKSMRRTKTQSSTRSGKQTTASSSNAQPTIAGFDFSPPQIPVEKATTQRGREFEVEVARLIEHLTGKRAKVCGGAGDGGIDIEVYDPVSGRRIGIVQCKCYRKDKVVPPAYHTFGNFTPRGCTAAYRLPT